MDPQQFKENQVATLPKQIGIYVLCDLDAVPIYIGKSADGIRARVRRHLTSARSDVIANRQIDVWEVAFVWAWETDDTKASRKNTEERNERLNMLEAQLFHYFNERSPLVNGTIPARPKRLITSIPECKKIQIITDEELRIRREPAYRLPRQIQHVAQLLDYILNVSDKLHLRRSLKVHFERLKKSYDKFLSAGSEGVPASEKNDNSEDEEN